MQHPDAMGPAKVISNYVLLIPYESLCEMKLL